MPNFIRDQNRFNLAGPPQWFLKQLLEFDDSLVLVPSRQGFFYRLAQRRPIQLSTAIVNDVLKEQADTAMLVAYGLIPVTTVLATTRWDNPEIFAELRRRAPWRMGGADKFNGMVEAQDRAEQIQQARQQDDMLNQVGKDAWRYYNKLIGTRTHLWSPTVKSRGEGSPAPAIILPKSQYSPVLNTGWGNTLRPRDRS